MFEKNYNKFVYNKFDKTAFVIFKELNDYWMWLWKTF